MHELLYAPASQHRLSASSCVLVGGRCVIFCLNFDFCDWKISLIQFCKDGLLSINTRHLRSRNYSNVLSINTMHLRSHFPTPSLRWLLCGGWRTLRYLLSESGFTEFNDLQDWISLWQISLLAAVVSFLHESLTKKIIRLPSTVSPLAFMRWLEDVAF